MTPMNSAIAATTLRNERKGLSAGQWLLILMTGIFFVASPLSMGTSGFANQAKYIRVALTLVMASYMLVIGLSRARRCTFWLLSFAVFYGAGALWSDSPVWGVLNKGLFVLTTASGLALAMAMRRQADLNKIMSILLIFLELTTLALLISVVLNPDAALVIGRLSVHGMNANTIGQTALPAVVLAAWVSMNSTTRAQRYRGIITSTALSLILLSTGSRGAAAAALAGILIVMAPHLKRPLRVAAGVTVAAVAYIVVSELVGLQISERYYEDLFKNTRSGIWNYAMRQFESSPAIGVGWVHHGNSSGNLHSVYLQVAVESGVVGLVLLGLVLCVVAATSQKIYSKLKKTHLELSALTLSLGLVASVLVHGVGEAGAILGSTVNCFMLAFGIGLLDRLSAPHFTQARRQQRGRLTGIGRVVNPPGVDISSTAARQSVCRLNLLPTSATW